ncbi:MAG: hypothetical protein ACXABI_00010 [Candidatus Hodarchaeales archaeon]|jgi:hypothetical protein
MNNLELNLSNPSKSSQIICHLCGFTFDSDICKISCEDCPSMFSCNLLRCPNCGYSFPSQESSLGRLIKRISSKFRQK